jgi:hypothetical protein
MVGHREAPEDQEARKGLKAQRADEVHSDNSMKRAIDEIFSSRDTIFKLDLGYFNLAVKMMLNALV